jgi:hypothetical protein
MTLDLTRYLDNIRSNARLERSDETIIMSELEAHIEDKIQELTDSGLTREEALKKCLDQMGSTRSIARQIYEAYSQGSWKQVLLASMPHFLFGLLFVLNWWHYPGWVSVVLVFMLATTVYGWSHGKPTWVFPWLGYTLLPVVVVGLMLLYLPRGWSFIVLPVYLGLALWWLFRIVILTLKRDWLFSSLMLLPLPVIIGWVLAISPSARFSEESMQQLYDYAPWIGLSFMGLALTIAVFIRLRQRWLRVSLLAASNLPAISLIVYYSTGYLINLAFLGLLLVMWGVLFIPLLLEKRLKKKVSPSQKCEEKGIDIASIE